MKKQIINRFLIICVLAIVSISFSLPAHYWGDSYIGHKLSQYKVTLGLDLAGGSELDYRIDMSDAIAQNNDDDPENNVDLNTIAESVRDALEMRVNPTGVGEVTVQRSQVDEEEHIIIQMPPSQNVDKAKSNAEKDNKLEFFEEDESKERTKKLEISKILNEITTANFSQKAAQLNQSDNATGFESKGPYFKNEILDTTVADKIMNAEANSIINEVLLTQTDMETSLSDDGQIVISQYPKRIYAIINVKDKITETREKTTKAKAEARHILFAYPGAMRAGEELPYSSKTDAKTKAEETLAILKAEGTDGFADLAKELSTEPAAKESGGSLGEFETGTMAPAFNDAIFAENADGLLPELIETDFGYHIIEVLKKTDAITSTEEETKVSYDILYWDITDINWIPTKLGGKQLENATAGSNEIGQFLVNLLFDNEGGDMFAELTGNVASRNCSRGPCRLGIKVGGKWITQPTVREKIIGTTAQITGSFSRDEALDLANGLNLGAIDAPVRLSGQTTITPELGKEQLTKSLKAGLFGFLATLIFMVFAYKFAGVVAVISLLLYATIYITLLKIWPGSFGGPIVLSLSGFAGIILSIGLAVDGNILIFERIKEELYRGRGLRQAIDLGFERAWNAIRDSNLTTLLVCFILYSVGSSIIKGFAITLIVGTLLSMFTAVSITRNLLRFSLLFKKFENKKLFGYSEDKAKNIGATIRERNNKK